jgi:hypothetical protein
MGEQFIEFLFAEYGARQSGLRELRSLVNIVGNFDHRLWFGSMTRRKNDGIYLQRDVIAGDDVLRRTSSASWRSETRTMRSSGRENENQSGPLWRPTAVGPRRKITPRSYSARIMMETKEIQGDDDDSDSS